jgi:Cu2+-exporting ATPase
MHGTAKGHKTDDAGEMHENHQMGMARHPDKSSKRHRGRHEGHKTEDFKRRFIISLIITIPILLLSSFIQELFRFELQFPGSLYVVFLLSSLVYFYGGYPFLKGFFKEVKDKNIGMMTLIATAISAAYFYSSAVVFGLMGETFFWELGTLIDIKVFCHRIEMR